MTLFDGTAREGVPHFPANVNIAAVLSLAGIGFDRTRLTVVADPGAQVQHPLHHAFAARPARSIYASRTVPSPDNPKTAMLACYSALAAIKAFGSSVRYGT